MPNKRALVVVAKQPAPGQTKTRLCPPLSHAQAAELYQCFLRDTLDMMRKVVDVDLLIGYLPENSQTYFRQLAPDMKLIFQHGNSLGERLDHLLEESINNGYQHVVIMDSDSPTLPEHYLTKAFDELTKVDVVFGPTLDGGYYLIGAKRPQPQLVRQVKMSTPHVLSDTIKLAEDIGLTFSLLPAWYDVDDISDLYTLNREINRLPINGSAPATRHWLKQTNWHDQLENK
jgi:rSAM/selenodomain-associated transferase 1